MPNSIPFGNNNLLLLILVVVAAVILMSSCKLNCSGIREGMSHRLTTTHPLKDDVYGFRSLPSFTQKWDFQLSSDKEMYHNIHSCEMKCSNVQGNTPHADCVEQCVRGEIVDNNPMKNNIPCDTHDDCGEREICVVDGAYTDGNGGYCMSDNEPGIPIAMRMAPGVARLSPGVAQLAPGVARLSPGVARLTPGIARLTQKMKDLVKSKRHSRYNTGPVISREGMRFSSVLRQHKAKSCPPKYYYNVSVDRCQPRLQGPILGRKGPESNVSLPGSTMPLYGTGKVDPYDVDTDFKLKTDM